MSDIWERLFGEGAKPHVLILTSERQLDWCLDVDNLRELQEHRVGVAVMFENLYENREQPTSDDTPGENIVKRRPVIGYHYADPKLVDKAMRALRMVGIRVGGYLNGHAWRNADLTPLDALNEIRRHGWQVIYFDNEGMSHDPQTLMWFMRAVKALGLTTICHTSITPGQREGAAHHTLRDSDDEWGGVPMDRYTRIVPEWQRLYADYRRVNETGPDKRGPKHDWEPTRMDDPLWRYWVSSALIDGPICAFKDGAWNQPSGGEVTVLQDSMWRGKELIWVPRMPPLGGTYFASPGMRWEIFTRMYWPAYAKLTREFRADPPEFRAARAEEFGVR